jgi:hypothetical protein
MRPFLDHLFQDPYRTRPTDRGICLLPSSLGDVANLLGVQDNYLDAYLRVIRATDPLRTALVFCCGMGAVRTTFAMVAASIVRRKQLIVRGLPDPYAMKSNGLSTPPPMRMGTPAGSVSAFIIYLWHSVTRVPAAESGTQHNMMGR